MNNELTTSFLFYKNAFTFRYESLLKEQLISQMTLKKELTLSLPKKLLHACTDLNRELMTSKIAVSAKELTFQCQSFYESVQLPRIKASLENKPLPKMNFSKFAEAIFKQPECYTLCNELNGGQNEYSMLIMEAENTKHLIKEAALIRTVTIGVISVIVGYAGYECFNSGYKRLGGLLATISSIIALASLMHMEASQPYNSSKW